MLLSSCLKAVFALLSSMKYFDKFEVTSAYPRRGKSLNSQPARSALSNVSHALDFVLAALPALLFCSLLPAGVCCGCVGCADFSTAVSLASQTTPSSKFLGTASTKVYSLALLLRFFTGWMTAHPLLTREDNCWQLAAVCLH